MIWFSHGNQSIIVKSMNEVPPQYDPKELIERAKAGDSEAFSMLYEHYLTPVFRYIYFRVGGKEEAEDLAQTVFIKAYKALSSFRQQGKDPLAYFYTIARNTVIDFQRKRREILGDTAETIEAVADQNTDVMHGITDRFEHERIQRAFRQLSDDQRDAVVLRFINDMSNEEIAAVMGKTEVAVRQLHSRGLKTLRELLTNESNEHGK